MSTVSAAGNDSQTHAGTVERRYDMPLSSTAPPAERSMKD